MPDLSNAVATFSRPAVCVRPPLICQVLKQFHEAVLESREGMGTVNTSSYTRRNSGFNSGDTGSPSRVLATDVHSCSKCVSVGM